MSIVTFAFFFLSIIFAMQLLSFHVRLPIIGRTRITFDLLMTPVLTIIVLWVAQCISTSHIRDGIVGKDGIKLFIFFIPLAYMATALDIIGILRAAAFWISNRDIRKLYFNTYVLLITSPLFPQTPLSSTPTTTDAATEEIDDNEDSVAQAEADDGARPATTPGRRKSKRGKKKKKAIGRRPATPTPSLIISDTILGYGSHGTVIYQGSFQGRAVAVKRLLQDFVTLATREISILQESDHHPNVIRYHYQEWHPTFIYIVLELCPASLADIIEGLNENSGGDGRAKERRAIVQWFDAKRAIKEVASGLRHLHGLGLVHRDIKPQNILVSSSSSGGRGGTGCRMLISDFGLCKKLDVDQTSFLPTGNGAGGTVGWRAPEILCGQVKLDEPLTGDDSTSSRGSITTVKGASPNGNGSTSTKTRLTKSVDIFALGCLFYYILTNGDHPYGDRFEREANIIKDNKKLSLLPAFCSTEESTEAADLITGMLHSQPCQRPDINACLLHPFFWNPAKRLRFLQDASDRFDVMCRDPMDAALIRLERDGWFVVGHDWYQMLDTIFVENLGKYRKYDGRSVRDLMRALRNKRHHYQSLPDDVKQLLGPAPENFLEYFTDRYPRLFMHVYEAVKDTGLQSEPMFRTYFTLAKT